ncbi:MAG: hypothetical protein ABF807_10420, partial [Liquorilactobacillus nagelii]|uniref:hypothetical protein n=1 Tax=Liquorilactobacillus nagelii TaxID=82688 RepID=UPI0039EBBE3B
IEIKLCFSASMAINEYDLAEFTKNSVVSADTSKSLDHSALLNGIWSRWYHFLSMTQNHSEGNEKADS